MQRLFFLVSALLSFAASLAVPNTTADNGPLTFEAEVSNGLQSIEKYASAAVRPYLEIYNFGTTIQPPFILPLANPKTTIVRAIDLAAKRLYTATSFQNPPSFQVSDRALTKEDADWSSFQFRHDLRGYPYNRAISTLEKIPRGGGFGFTACWVGIPPKDPFNPRVLPTSVLWICNPFSALNGDQLVLKVSNGAIGRFSWSSMGVIRNDALLVNSSLISQIT